MTRKKKKQPHVKKRQSIEQKYVRTSSIWLSAENLPYCHLANQLERANNHNNLLLAVTLWSDLKHFIFPGPNKKGCVCVCVPELSLWSISTRLVETCLDSRIISVHYLHQMVTTEAA